MASLVEVLEVQRIVDALVNVGPVERPLAHLELDHKDGAAADKDRIDAPAHARYRELEKDAA